MSGQFQGTSVAPDFVRWFRNSSPYINAHKGRTFVLSLGGELLDDAGVANLVHDIALLSSLGVRLVLVHGARPQLESRLQHDGLDTEVVNGRRVTDHAALRRLQEVCGVLRTRLESLLSMDLANSPMQGSRIRVCGGNFVIARPVGVVGGVDFRHTGCVRRIDSNAIHQQLDAGYIVLLSPLGISPTGELFSLTAEELAVATAVAAKADKLLLFRDGLLRTADGDAIRELTLAEAEEIAARNEDGSLFAAVAACRDGVPRCHLLDYHADGALLQELFTRDGCGTLVKPTPFEVIRAASITDLTGIMELLAPLEAEGVLVRRSRELLEMEIDHFHVATRDGAIIACAALYPDQAHGCAELAAVATHPDYRRGGRAERLLQHLEVQAQQQGLHQLFVLTTVSGHWFQQRGFIPVPLESLPAQRQALYNYQRNSLVYLKNLES